MANDSFLPQDKLLALATLLKEALCIKHDLTGRIAQHPNQESLLKQYKEYQQLVARLNWELDRELTRYLARIKGDMSSARAALRTSSRASAASDPRRDAPLADELPDPC